MNPKITRDRAGHIASVELPDHITVGYDGDDNEIEEAVVVELDCSPAEPEVDCPEASFDVTRVRYAGTGKAVGVVENRFISTEMIQAWEEQAAEFIVEFLEDERAAADDARYQARKDGE